MAQSAQESAAQTRERLSAVMNDLFLRMGKAVLLHPHCAEMYAQGGEAVVYSALHEFFESAAARERRVAPLRLTPTQLAAVARCTRRFIADAAPVTPALVRPASVAEFASAAPLVDRAAYRRALVTAGFPEPLLLSVLAECSELCDFACRRLGCRVPMGAVAILPLLAVCASLVPAHATGEVLRALAVALSAEVSHNDEIADADTQTADIRLLAATLYVFSLLDSTRADSMGALADELLAAAADGAATAVEALEACLSQSPDEWSKAADGPGGAGTDRSRPGTSSIAAAAPPDASHDEPARTDRDGSLVAEAAALAERPSSDDVDGESALSSDTDERTAEDAIDYTFWQQLSS